jgi:DDE_Tnp_1-associated
MIANSRCKRRTLSMLRKRLDEARFFQIEDPRNPCNRRWRLSTLLRSVVMGIACGAKNLQDVERLTEEGTPASRLFLGVGARRIPDTTLRDTLCQLTPEAVTPALHRVVKAAQRRKSLNPESLPFGVVSLDGKSTAISGCDDHYAQRQTRSESSSLVGNVRTVTATLTSCNARPVVDVISIPAHTNELGQYAHALRSVISHYSRSDLFRLVTYDAGACSAYNGEVTRELGLHYLFGLKLPHASLLEEVHRVLGKLSAQQCAAFSEDDDGQYLLRRTLWLASGAAVSASKEWHHLNTILRVRSERIDANGNLVSCEDRYFISSLPSSRLNAAQWLLLIRNHWRVELAHQTLDQAFAEDDKPWIRSDPRGMLVVAVLRRIAYTLLTLYRSVSLRSDAHRSLPWKDLLRWVEMSLLTATDTLLSGLRRHRIAQME